MENLTTPAMPQTSVRFAGHPDMVWWYEDALPRVKKLLASFDPDPVISAQVFYFRMQDVALLLLESPETHPRTDALRSMLRWCFPFDADTRRLLDCDQLAERLTHETVSDCISRDKLFCDKGGLQEGVSCALALTLEHYGVYSHADYAETLCGLLNAF